MFLFTAHIIKSLPPSAAFALFFLLSKTQLSRLITPEFMTLALSSHANITLLLCTSPHTRRPVFVARMQPGARLSRAKSLNAAVAGVCQDHARFICFLPLLALHYRACDEIFIIYAQVQFARVQRQQLSSQS